MGVLKVKSKGGFATGEGAHGAPLTVRMAEGDAAAKKYMNRIARLHPDKLVRVREGGRRKGPACACWSGQGAGVGGCWGVWFSGTRFSQNLCGTLIHAPSFVPPIIPHS